MQNTRKKYAVKHIGFERHFDSNRESVEFCYHLRKYKHAHISVNTTDSGTPEDAQK